MIIEKILQELNKMASLKVLEKKKNFGINTENSLGITIPNLRKLAKKLGKNHELALLLWQTTVKEAQILATMIDSPKYVTEKQMQEWVNSFNSWDLCDQTCQNLFCKTPFSESFIKLWCNQEKEFVKRAGFVLIACHAMKSRKLSTERAIFYLNLIKQHSTDNRNFVKKAVNWALRGIGKKNPEFNMLAINTSNEILSKENLTSNWIAKDALRELQSKSIQDRLI